MLKVGQRVIIDDEFYGHVAAPSEPEFVCVEVDDFDGELYTIELSRVQALA